MLLASVSPACGRVNAAMDAAVNKAIGGVHDMRAGSQGWDDASSLDDMMKGMYDGQAGEGERWILS